EWVHVQLHQQKGMISLSPPTICNSARCLGCARGCRYPPLPSSTLDNAAAVIAADARAGLFGPVRLARPSACLGEISGGRINGGASPPFVRVKAEDSSLKNIRL
ncbi:hypothetical protein, partial [Klebsiella pneumoniae]|uniref:hypothetical protein n=1 Tax=Klebsiella pneumoniae TaxID=573 RepID=UPI0022AEAFCC